MDLYPFFDWLDTSPLAEMSKAYGGVFAVVQMFHLLGISLLGGMVLLGDLRLLNLVMKDVPSEVVIENTYKWFNVALVMVVISGVFMSSAVALKLYYNSILSSCNSSHRTSRAHGVFRFMQMMISLNKLA